MGSQISSLDYKNIREVKDLVNINDNNKRKYIHIIKFNNNKEKIIKLNKNEEVKFELRYKYTKMFRDIAKIQYYKISEIIKTNIDENKYKLLNKYIIDDKEIYKYRIKIILNDDNICCLDMNTLQYNLFCKLNKDINKNIIIH